MVRLDLRLQVLMGAATRSLMAIKRASCGAELVRCATVYSESSWVYLFQPCAYPLTAPLVIPADKPYSSKNKVVHSMIPSTSSW